MILTAIINSPVVRITGHRRPRLTRIVLFQPSPRQLVVRQGPLQARHCVQLDVPDVRLAVQQQVVHVLERVQVLQQAVRQRVQDVQARRSVPVAQFQCVSHPTRKQV